MKLLLENLQFSQIEALAADQSQIALQAQSGISCAGSPMVMGRQAYEKLAEERRAEQDAWPAQSEGSKGTAFALNHHVHHVSKVQKNACFQENILTQPEVCVCMCGCAMLWQNRSCAQDLPGRHRNLSLSCLESSCIRAGHILGVSRTVILIRALEEYSLSSSPFSLPWPAQATRHASMRYCSHPARSMLWHGSNRPLLLDRGQGEFVCALPCFLGA